MSDKRTLVLPDNKLALIQCISSMRLSWLATLRALALMHNNRPGPWLDDLEREILNGLKNTTTDAASLDDEARTISPSVQLAIDVLADVREALEGELGNSDDKP